MSKKTLKCTKKRGGPSKTWPLKSSVLLREIKKLVKRKRLMKMRIMEVM